MFTTGGDFELRGTIGQLGTGELVMTDGGCCNADFDDTADVGLGHMAIFQRCFSGAGTPPEPGCGE